MPCDTPTPLGRSLRGDAEGLELLLERSDLGVLRRHDLAAVAPHLRLRREAGDAGLLRRTDDRRVRAVRRHDAARERLLVEPELLGGEGLARLEA